MARLPHRGGRYGAHLRADRLPGVNYYTRCVVQTLGAVAAVAPNVGRSSAHRDGWEVYPHGLRDLLISLHAQTRLPLYVTENGAAFADEATDPTGAVADEDRWQYLEAHLGAVVEARASGAAVRGYFAWSLLDNFEWAYGYTASHRHVAFETQRARPTIALVCGRMMNSTPIEILPEAESRPACNIVPTQLGGHENHVPDYAHQLRRSIKVDVALLGRGTRRNRCATILAIRYAVLGVTLPLSVKACRAT